jgi:hypothetical protein
MERDPAFFLEHDVQKDAYIRVDDKDVSGLMEHGNGLMKPRNGHMKPGNGYIEPGNGHMEKGNGHVEKGNGHIEHGNGHVKPGNGHMEPGNGQMSRYVSMGGSVAGADPIRNPMTVDHLGHVELAERE